MIDRHHDGLTGAEAAARLTRDGFNELLYKRCHRRALPDGVR